LRYVQNVIARNGKMRKQQGDKTMTSGQKNEQTKAYVEGACNAFLTAYKDVEKVEYRSDGSNSYVKVTTAFGFSNYFDVTDLDDGHICIMLSGMMCNRPTKRLIKDKEAKREVEKLFK